MSGAVNVTIGVVGLHSSSLNGLSSTGDATLLRRGIVSGGQWIPGSFMQRLPLSGLTALGAEVIWTRLLSLILGPTVYAFSIIWCVLSAGDGQAGVPLLARGVALSPGCVVGGASCVV